ncbi:MAG: protein translocase subunit SecF [Syntrophaceae bacterium]|nr:protein translocase subunit SecF [Deltaproteobacteria bacterium]
MEFIRPNIYFDFMKVRNYAFAASLLLIVISLVSLIFVRGLNYGIDFAGGTEIQLAVPASVKTEDLRNALKPLGIAEARIQSVSSSGGTSTGISTEYIIRIAKSSEAGKDLTSQIENTLRDAFGKDKVDIRRADMVGAAVSKDLKEKGFLSLLYAWIGILIYLWWRFEFSYSAGAIIALVHDVTITVGIFSLLGKEMDLTIIAAILTIIGYSVNDTVVVFDRIRENIKKKEGSQDIYTVVNESVSQTLSRTILTSLTVFIVVVALFFLGGSIIHNFAFALIIGVVVGTYSSIFIASPIMVLLNRDKK